MTSPHPIKTLGPCRVSSPLPLNRDPESQDFRFVEEGSVVLHSVREAPGVSETVSPFEMAGPRADVFFDPPKVHVGIVTCGGLCPGSNNVIRTLVMQLYHNYGVRNIHGFRYGFQGFIPKYGHEVRNLTPESVKNIHYLGGSILSSSRGPQDVGEIVDCLDRNSIRVLFVIGGDGTLRGAHGIAQEVKERGLKIAVVGIPKTIDNDIPFCVKTFGFETAFSKAMEAVQSAHSEAYGNNNGIVIIKLMGRDSGFIAANTSLACPDVNFVLVPEVPFTLGGERGLLKSLERVMEKKRSERRHPHSVIVVAEGVGQDLMGNTGEERDASGNVRYRDIGEFLKGEIKEHFADRLPVNVKVIEPSYLIRSLPANAHDAIFCYYLADHAVHAGMSGKTDLMIGYWNGYFTHVPLDLVAQHQKRIDPNSDFWRLVLFSTGQPRDMCSPGQGASREAEPPLPPQL